MCPAPSSLGLALALACLDIHYIPSRLLDGSSPGKAITKLGDIGVGANIDDTDECLKSGLPDTELSVLLLGRLRVHRDVTLHRSSEGLQRD